MDHKNDHVNVIRETHRSLRRKLAGGDDFEKVWKSHCSNDRVLRDYSSAMKELATTVWEVECDGKDRTEAAHGHKMFAWSWLLEVLNNNALHPFGDAQELARIVLFTRHDHQQGDHLWCNEYILEYFRDGGLSKLLEKDKRRKQHYEKEHSSSFTCGPNTQSVYCFRESKEETKDASFVAKEDKLILFDVGSCFNPFSFFPHFDTLAVDLAPANEKVFKCDFISVEVDDAASSPQTVEATGTKSISKIPSTYFDVVVFSLLLSYIPCPYTRWRMCQKAHKILKVNGLLLIITPDSSHQNRHAALMKKWKTALENIGFQRVKYSKDKHFHFLAFRKVPPNHIWDKRKSEDTFLYLLNIPQDFTVGLHEPEENKADLNRDKLPDNEISLLSCNELNMATDAETRECSTDKRIKIFQEENSLLSNSGPPI